MSWSEQVGGKLEDSDFYYTLSLINGKFKIVVLYCLNHYGVVRFNEMKKHIPYISFKMLSTTLKELEADGLVHRQEFMQIPPKVEYRLSERGKSLLPLLDEMCLWAKENREEKEELEQ